jgi:hypothetical protein
MVIDPAVPPESETLDIEISCLLGLDAAELRARWHTAFGRRAPSPAPGPGIARSRHQINCPQPAAAAESTAVGSGTYQSETSNETIAAILDPYNHL